MKPTKEHFQLREDLEVKVDYTAREIEVKRTEGTDFSLTFADLTFLAAINDHIIGVPLDLQPAQQKRQDAIARGLASGTPTPNETSAVNPAVMDLDDLDIQTMGMYVVCKNGTFYPATGKFGQHVQCNASVDEAMLFVSTEAAAQFAQQLGAEVLPFPRVANYRIMVQGANGIPLFWRGHDLPLSDHVNSAACVTGRVAALQVLAAVRTEGGYKKYIRPVTR